MEADPKTHWEKIYESKPAEECSWFQAHPQASLLFIERMRIPKEARIIDIGGGDSRLVDELLDRGYSNITVLDISEHAIQRARQRLGDRASRVHWVVSDMLDFEPQDDSYDLWHDRAAFHFLTTDDLVHKYAGIVKKAVAPDGFLLVGTFSEHGPVQCSGLPVRRYSRKELESVFHRPFKIVYCERDTHLTPFQKSQEFMFCGFRK